MSLPGSWREHEGIINVASYVLVNIHDLPARRELKELLHLSMIQYLDTDSSDSSSDEEEVAYSALAELSGMVPQVQLGPRLTL